jgi:hypothetical protein
VDTVFEYDLVEVDQKTQWFIQESHVAKQLSLVNWKDLLDCLELNDETIVNQHVKTKWFFEDNPFVFDWNAQFVFGCAAHIPCARICGRWAPIILAPSNDEPQWQLQ